MELEFDIADDFDNDIQRLSKESRDKIVDHINLVAASLLNGRKEFNDNASVPYIFNLKGGYHSSLYLLKADTHNRIVVAVDDDPIFDKKILTLYRLVDEHIAEKTYKEVGEKIYTSYGML
jgi:mRNA-degrading endonuclease RelE of RelBE toxin-antitoxin system